MQSGGTTEQEKIAANHSATTDKLLRSSWTSFDDYKEAARAFWTVKVIGDAWEDSVCSCPVFQKQLICKHSLGMAIRLKYIRAPDEAKTVPIGRKRKRGRPSKARPALILR